MTPNTPNTASDTVSSPQTPEYDRAVELERSRCLAIIDDHLAKLDRARMPTEAFRLATVREQIAGTSETYYRQAEEQK